MGAPAQSRHGAEQSRDAQAAVTRRRTDRSRIDALDAYARSFVPLVRKLERNWPVSVALLFLAFMILSFLNPG
jgi:hypothetical protein